jgi:cytochrome c-type biogenesis protein CcmE
MGFARVTFESIDESTQRQAQELELKLHAAGGKRVTLQMEGQLAELFERIAGVIAQVGGFASGQSHFKRASVAGRGRLHPSRLA